MLFSSQPSFSHLGIVQTLCDLPSALGLTKTSKTLTKGVFSRCPLLCQNVSLFFPIIYWETGGKEVESGRKRYEGVAFGGIKYDAVGTSRKRYYAVSYGAIEKMSLYFCSVRRQLFNILQNTKYQLTIQIFMSLLKHESK